MTKLTQTLVSIGGGALFFLTGCQSTHFTNPYQRIGKASQDQLSTEPLTIDGAMQQRDWERSTAVYANGDTIAGPTGFWYEPRPDQPEWRYAVLETPLFVFQTVALPVTLAITPPWTNMRYTGAEVGTTYTAMPPLPPSYATAEINATPAMMPTTQPGM